MHVLESMNNIILAEFDRLRQLITGTGESVNVEKMLAAAQPELDARRKRLDDEAAFCVQKIEQDTLRLLEELSFTEPKMGGRLRWRHRVRRADGERLSASRRQSC